MDLALNPGAKLPNRHRLGPAVLEHGSGVPMHREAFLQGASLIVFLQAGDLKSMRNG